MKKHIAEALKAVGLLRSTPLTYANSGHISLHVGNWFVIASSTPGSPHAAAKCLARDLSRALITAYEVRTT